ncbi:MAG: protoporphyrinogen oxidase HemJ [Cyanobacteria bacterium P01_A01_bin.84]
MTYYWLKAFHIIGVVVWFAGLFYLVRLFIYHVEAEQETEPAQTILKNQYQIMEKRLYSIITTPGMVVTVGCAIGLLISQPDYLKQGWLHVKLGFVVALLIYHFYCDRLMKQLENGTCKWGSKQLRALNEAPTIMLLVIVLLAVFKGNFPTDTAVWVVFGTVVLTAVTIQLYAKKRRQDKEKQIAEQISQVPQEQA